MKEKERLTRLAEHVYPLEHLDRRIVEETMYVSSDHPSDAVEYLRPRDSLFTMMRWAIQQGEGPCCQTAGCLAGYTCALFYDERTPEESIQ